MSRKTNSIRAITITYKNDRTIEKCLKKLFSSTLVPSKTTIIDNNSPNSPHSLIKRSIKDDTSLSFIRNKNNMGFARAVNQGVKNSKEKFILLINPDFFVDKDSLKLMHEFIKDREDVAMVGGRVKNNQTGQVEHTVTNKISPLTALIEFTSLKKLFSKAGLDNISGFWNKRAIISKENKPIEVDMVSGCFALIKKSVLDKVRGLDNHFFLYLEDLDLSMRIRKSGYKIFYLPKATGKHVSGESSVFESPHKINEKAWNDSKRYFSIKHFGIIGYFLSLIYSLDNWLIKTKKVLFKK